MKLVPYLLAAAGLACGLVMAVVVLTDKPPPLEEQIAAELKADGTQDKVWLYYCTGGPLKGQTADAVGVILNYRREDLVAMGCKTGDYVVADCANYSTTGDPLALNRQAVQYCRWDTTTEQAVREYAQSLASPPGVS